MPSHCIWERRHGWSINESDRMELHESDATECIEFDSGYCYSRNSMDTSVWYCLDQKTTNCVSVQPVRHRKYLTEACEGTFGFLQSGVRYSGILCAWYTWKALGVECNKFYVATFYRRYPRKSCFGCCNGAAHLQNQRLLAPGLIKPDLIQH